MANRLRRSNATWKVWGCSVGTLDFRADPQNLPEGLTRPWPGAGYAGFGGDDFSGAYVERAEIYDLVREAGITGFATVAGDRHSFWAGLSASALPPERFEPVGVTFITGSVSAPGLVEALEQGIDSDGRVIYVGTFSKVLFPSIQTGYIVAPPPLVSGLIAARSFTGHPSSKLEHAVLCDFIEEGHFARHLRRMRVQYAERQKALLSEASRELSGLIDLAPSEAGMHLIGWLPEGVDDRRAWKAAIDAGVEVTPLSAYCFRRPERGALRLGYTGFTPRQIRQGVRRLGEALRGL